MRRTKTSREDRWDAEEQREPSLGDTSCEGTGDAIRWLSSSSKAKTPRHLFLILQVSCSRKNTSKYGKPFTLHPADGVWLRSCGRLSPEQGGGSFPHALSVPEPGLTHRTGMSAHHNQQPQTAPISALCPTRRISYEGAGLELLHTGCSTQVSCGPLVLSGPRGPGGCCSSAPKPPGAVQAGHGPAGTRPSRMQRAGPGNWQAGLCCGVLKRKQVPAQETSTAAEGTGLSGWRLLECGCRSKAEMEKVVWGSAQ